MNIGVRGAFAALLFLVAGTIASVAQPIGSPVKPTRLALAPLHILALSPNGTAMPARPHPLVTTAAATCTAYAPATTTTPPEIVELARALKDDPALIFQYVHDNIEFDPIWGSMKGAYGTLLDGRGGAFDQSALLVALLTEASKYNTAITNVQFAQGRITLSAAQIEAWLRTDADINSMANVLYQGGYPNDETWYGSGTTVTQAVLDHVWVQATISGVVTNFDPAFKTYVATAGINLAGAMGYTQGGLLTDATSGAVTGAASLKLSAAGYANIGADLSKYATNLANTIATSYPTASLQAIIGGATIQPANIASLANLGPVSPASVTTYPAIANTLRATLQITLQGAACEQFYSSDIYGHRLSILSGGATNAPVLSLDGAQILASPTSFTTGAQISVLESVSLPWATQFAQTRTQYINAGSLYVVMNGWDQVGHGMIEKHQRILAQNRAAGSADASEPVLGEGLDIIGYSWLAQNAQHQRITDEILGLRTEYLYGVGIVGQSVGPSTQGPYVDLPLNFINTPVRNNGSASTAADRGLSAFFDDSGVSSGFEAGVLRQTAGLASNGVVSSTTAILNLAAQSGQTFYDLNSTTYPTYSASLNWTAGNLATLSGVIGQGFRCIVPSAPAAQTFAFGNWKGVGFKGILISGSSYAILEQISGGLSGGFTGDTVTPTTIDTTVSAATPASTPPAVDTSSGGISKPSWFSSALSAIGDPVDPQSGSYVYSHDDLAIGPKGFPYGLGFQRNYASGAAQIAGPLGNGWTHNFAYTATTTSDGFSGLGAATALAAAPVIAATVVSADLLQLTGSTQPTLTQLVVGAIVDQWLIDRLVQNVVAITEPTGIEHFVALPAALADGRLFAPPAGSATRLTQGTGTTYQGKDGVTLAFNSAGQLATLSNAAGVIVTLTYNGSGQLTQVANNLGRKLSFTYSGTQLATVSDVPASGTARTVTYTYDSHNNLASVKDPLGQVDSFVYDTAGTYYAAVGHLTQVLYPSGGGKPFVTNVYDSLGRVKQQTDASGNVTQAYFGGNRTELVNAIGSRHAWYLDTSSRVTSEIQDVGGLALTTSYQYDGQGNLAKLTAPSGNAVSYSYDALFNPLTVTQIPRPGSAAATAGQTLVSSLAYTRPVAALVNFEKPATAKDPLGNVTSYAYDTSGNLSKVTHPAVTKPGVTGSVVPSESFTYVNFGQVQTATDAEGRVTRTDYDTTALDNAIRLTVDYGTGRLNLITQTAYDGDGNVVSVTDPNGHTTTSTYDSLRRPTQVSGAIAGVTTSYTYDSEGRVLSVARATGVPATPLQTTTTVYTPTGKPKTVTDPAGFVTTSAYDGVDRLASLTDAASRIRSFAYDKADRLLSVTDATAGAGSPVLEAYGYTPNGRTSSFTDARGKITTYVYDGFDRLLTLTYPDGSTVGSAYDADGNLLTKTVPSGGTIGFTYDALNRVLSKTPAGETAGTVTYGYDMSGLLLQAADASSANAFRVTYDTAGRPIQRTDQNNLAWTRSYDAASNQITQGYPNGASVTYQHDALNRVTEIDLQSATPLPIAKYQWDALSRRTGLTYGDGSTAAYTYTANNDLATLTHTLPGSNSVSFTYGYNHDHQRISESASNAAYAFVPAAASVSYGAASAINAYPTAGSATLTYDSNHNLTFDGANTLAYDVENRLVSASNTGATASYHYDPLGHRKQSTVGTAVTSFFEDGDREIAEFTGAAANLTAFVRGPGDEVVASIGYPAAAVTYYHNNPLGSPLAVTSGGAVTNLYAYGPFGETAPLAGPAFRFTGQRLDAETGLYYARARHYSPTLGRFVQTDPSGYAGGKNLYAYVGNDPVNLVDPSGLFASQAGSALYNLVQCPSPCLANDGEGVLSSAANLYNAAASNPQLTMTVLGTIALGGGPEDPFADAAAAAEIAAAEAQAAGATRGVAAALKVGDTIFTDISSGAARQIGQTPTAIDSSVQNLIDSFAENSPFAGKCAEIGCVSQALNAGVNPSGGSIATAAIRGAGNAAQGTPVPPCITCSQVLQNLGIKVVP